MKLFQRLGSLPVLALVLGLAALTAPLAAGLAAFTQLGDERRHAVEVGSIERGGDVDVRLEWIHRRSQGRMAMPNGKCRACGRIISNPCPSP